MFKTLSHILLSPLSRVFQYANKVTTLYTYDVINRLATIGSGTKIETLSYDANSNITQKKLASTITDTYTYNSLDELTAIAYKDNRFSTTFTGETYTYDTLGNKTAERTNTQNGTGTQNNTYTKNTLNQYTAYTGTTVLKVGTGTVTTTTGVTLSYDKNGNLIATTEKGKKQYEYSYDANNRLISAYQYDTNNQSTKYLLTEYSYDPLGRRTTKKVATYKNPTTATGTLTLSGYTLSEYLYDGNNLLEESIYSLTTTGTKTLTAKKEYAYKNTNTPTASNTDDIISVLYTTYKTPTTVNTTTDTYYEKDHLGSIIRITSSTGGIIDEYSYTAFGKPYRKTQIKVGTGTSTVYLPLTSGLGLSTTGNTSPVANTILYTGREYDREVNLYYLRARYYDPSTSRFISRDPIGTNDQINLYTYVANNPMKYVDRDGREKKIIGTLRIYSWYDDENARIDGHSWIEITVGDEVITYGIGQYWGSTKDTKQYSIGEGSNILKNYERDIGYKKEGNMESIGMGITQTQLNQINDYIDTSVKDGYQWGYLSPCTDFSSDIWNMVSPIQLQDRSYAGVNTPIGLSTPDALAVSIAKVKLAKEKYESSGNYNKDENPYKNIIY